MVQQQEMPHGYVEHSVKRTNKTLISSLALKKNSWPQISRNFQNNYIYTCKNPSKDTNWTVLPGPISSAKITLVSDPQADNHAAFLPSTIQAAHQASVNLLNIKNAPIMSVAYEKPNSRQRYNV